jgi:hypothetical protein
MPAGWARSRGVSARRCSTSSRRSKAPAMEFEGFLVRDRRDILRDVGGRQAGLLVKLFAWGGVDGPLASRQGGEGPAAGSAGFPGDPTGRIGWAAPIRSSVAAVRRPAVL